MTAVNVGCGPFRAPPPWVNLDVHRGDGVEPDVLVADPSLPLAGYDDDSVERVYLGHVVEHMPWPALPAFLADIARAMTPGGAVCVVGPDLFRAIRMWHDAPTVDAWRLIESIAETPWRYAEPEPGDPDWGEARHWWNSYEDRVVYAVRAAGFVDVTAVPVEPASLGDWPVVAYTAWQCAVTARKAESPRLG